MYHDASWLSLNGTIGMLLCSRGCRAEPDRLPRVDPEHSDVGNGHPPKFWQLDTSKNPAVAVKEVSR